MNHGPIIALMIAATLTVLLAEWLVKRVEVGVAVILVCVVLGVVLNDNLPGTIPSVSLGPAEVQVTDIAFGLVLAAAIARLMRVRRLNWAQWGLAVFGLLALLSLVRGVGQFGPEASAAEFRSFMRFTAAALYVASFHRPSGSVTGSPSCGWWRPSR